MRAEKIKWITAAMSMASVLAVTFTVIDLKGFDSPLSRLTIYATMGAAMVASVMSIWISRRLELKRSSGRVFIVYAREDVDTAMSLYEKLAAEGFRPWLDVNDIQPGEIWSKTVNRAIEESRAALVLISKNLSEKEGFVHKEIHAAMSLLHDSSSGSHVVIPVRLDDVPVPDALHDIQWVNLYEEKGFERLSLALQKIVAQQD